MRGLGWALLAVLGDHRPVPATTSDGEAETCGSGEACDRSPGVSSSRRGGRYIWPQHRGHVGEYGIAAVEGPVTLSEPTWTWHHPAHRFGTIVLGGPLLDDKSNIYLSSHHCIWKLGSNGSTLWSFWPKQDGCRIPTIPALLDGALYGSDVCGNVWAVDMETGRELWTTKVARDNGGDTATVSAHEGVVVAGMEGTPQWGYNGENKVLGLNATDGTLLWERRISPMAWNFLALFVGDGTFVFQDSSGGAYRIRLLDGELLWKTPSDGTLTDGSAMLGSNGVVYTVCLKGEVPGALFRPDDHGYITAYRLTDGKKLWRTEVPRPPNSVPVVGRLSGAGPLSVIVGIGAQGGEPAFTKYITKMGLSQQAAWALHELTLWLGDWSWLLWGNKPLPTELWALDAETGQKLWSWEADNWYRMACAGDEEGYRYRTRTTARGLCWPGPWSSPVLDAAGTLYAGSHNGKFYALRDADGDGKIDTKTETSSVDFEASFSFGSAALGPGMLAMSSCDSLFVWKW